MRDGRDDLQRIMDEALEGMAREAGRPLDLGHINLAEFCRGTGPARQGAGRPGATDSGWSLTGSAAGAPRPPCPAATPALSTTSPGRASPTRRSCSTSWSPRATRAGRPRSRCTSRATGTSSPPRGGRPGPRAAAGSGPGVPPARRTRRAGGLPPSAAPTVPRAEAPASAWHATIAACPTSTSSPMRGRRTCLSGCSAPSWPQASPRKRQSRAARASREGEPPRGQGLRRHRAHRRGGAALVRAAGRQVPPRRRLRAVRGA